MNENTDKHLDELSRKVIRQSAIEQPSFDFTKKVMFQIKTIETTNATTYVPLISKRVWLLIAMLLIVLTAFVFFGTLEFEHSWLRRFQLAGIPKISISNPFSAIEFSQTTFYALLLFAIMMCVQIPILKRHFDKRLEV